MKSNIIIPNILKLWNIFDSGFKHSNDLILLNSITDFLSEHPITQGDVNMYRNLLHSVKTGGFLIKEEKEFLINYAILLVSEYVKPDDKYSLIFQLRNCSSILDVWPDRAESKINYRNLELRKEWVIWFIRKYEVLGNTFLRKRNITNWYYGIELAKILQEQKCKLYESEYEHISNFLKFTNNFFNNDEVQLSDFKREYRIMCKLIWKIKQGITKYS